MLDNTYIPSFPLNQFVYSMWVGKEESLNLSSSHHAPLFTELIFNYGDQFDVEGQNIENDKGTNGHYIISGLKTSPFETRVAGAYHNIGLLLKPFCYDLLRRKFGTVEMDDLSNLLYEHLFLPPTPRFEDVEHLLLTFFEGSNIDSDLQNFERQLSFQTLQKGSMTKFNRTLTITQKSFIQKFKKHYILTPNQYVKLRQVNHAIQLMSQPPTKNLTQIGLEAGFYDQSHFIRVFKGFCGMTPKRFTIEGMR